MEDRGYPPVDMTGIKAPAPPPKPENVALKTPDEAILETIHLKNRLIKSLIAKRAARDEMSSQYDAECRHLKEKIIEADKLLRGLGVMDDDLWL